MALRSMTGFGRAGGSVAGRSWCWELRSVNSRGLDLRLKLPGGMDVHEPVLRRATEMALKRGAVQAQLTVGVTAGSGGDGAVSVRTDVLQALVKAACALATHIPGAPAPRAEVLLTIPGVLRIAAEAEPSLNEEAVAAIIEGYTIALNALVAAREAEGGRLGQILAHQIGEIGALSTQARGEAEHQPAAQLRRLRESLRSMLSDTAVNVSEERLAQEMALLASRSDVLEELDRLDSHVMQARSLLSEDSPVGRRLDFLVQELNREVNTLCAKAAIQALTTTGMELKAAIEQFREQVQNIE